MSPELSSILAKLRESGCNLAVKKPTGYHKYVCTILDQIEHRFINGDDFILAIESRQNGKSKFTVEIETA